MPEAMPCLLRAPPFPRLREKGGAQVNACHGPGNPICLAVVGPEEGLESAGKPIEYVQTKPDKCKSIEAGHARIVSHFLFLSRNNPGPLTLRRAGTNHGVGNASATALNCTRRRAGETPRRRCAPQTCAHRRGSLGWSRTHRGHHLATENSRMIELGLR